MAWFRPLRTPGDGPRVRVTYGPSLRTCGTYLLTPWIRTPPYGPPGSTYTPGFPATCPQGGWVHQVWVVPMPPQGDPPPILLPVPLGRPAGGEGGWFAGLGTPSSPVPHLPAGWLPPARVWFRPLRTPGDGPRVRVTYGPSLRTCSTYLLTPWIRTPPYGPCTDLQGVRTHHCWKLQSVCLSVTYPYGRTYSTYPYGPFLRTYSTYVLLP